MNKRIKKKKAFEIKVVALTAHAVILEESIKSLKRENDNLRDIVELNAQATNNRFDTVEVDIKALKKTQKKSWFSRK
ncbi:hypothetical protein [Streptococcus suis]|uniref:Phage protein n=1 Tax=Streptococcus suis TaxID=1307 RepID=A0A0Z8KGR7_STRSU|nr:hypothetical protein [Streptococcus suis]NQG44765.1 hypothetical protein [Streptococcus suis]CYV72014.1 phage protein [Streptococcus suis]